MTFRIREALLSDAPALAELLRQIGWWPMFEEETQAENLARVAQLLALDLADDSHSVYIAEDMTNGALLGYIAAHWLPYLFLRGAEGFISNGPASPISGIFLAPFSSELF